MLKSGESYREALFILFKKIWNTIKIPQQCRKTIIIQLHKGKGPEDDFNNMRNIHTKLEVPKLFENMLLLRVRPKIVEGTSKYQIGAMSGHRSSEHIFTLKSVIALYELVGKP